MCFQTCSLGPTALRILHVSLIYTPDSDHQLIKKELHELKLVCQIRETSKMCRSVGPKEQD